MALAGFVLNFDLGFCVKVGMIIFPLPSGRTAYSATEIHLLCTQYSLKPKTGRYPCEILWCYPDHQALHRKYKDPNQNHNEITAASRTPLSAVYMAGKRLILTHSGGMAEQCESDGMR